MTTFSSYLDENLKVLGGVPDSVVEEFVQVLSQVRDSGGTVWCLGNGGSATLASHAVGDFAKTSKQHGAKPLFAIAPSEMTALQTAYANDESFEDAFSSTLYDFAEARDAVWIISVSGTSPNLLKAAKAARAKGARVLSTLGIRGKALCLESDVGIEIPSDDYQVVENAHVVLMHWFTKQLAICSV